MVAAVVIQARSASCRAAADRWPLTSARTSAEATERTMATSIVSVAATAWVDRK